MSEIIHNLQITYRCDYPTNADAAIALADQIMTPLIRPDDYTLAYLHKTDGIWKRNIYLRHPISESLMTLILLRAGDRVICYDHNDI